MSLFRRGPDGEAGQLGDERDSNAAGPGRLALLTVSIPSVVMLASALVAVALAVGGAHSGAVEPWLYGIYLGWVLALGGLGVILVTSRGDRLRWSVVLVCLALLSSLLSLGIWAVALSIACNPGSGCTVG